jgi:hypothetical protein
MDSSIRFFLAMVEKRCLCGVSPPQNSIPCKCTEYTDIIRELESTATTADGVLRTGPMSPLIPMQETHVIDPVKSFASIRHAHLLTNRAIELPTAPLGGVARPLMDPPSPLPRR